MRAACGEEQPQPLDGKTNTIEHWRNPSLLVSPDPYDHSPGPLPKNNESSLEELQHEETANATANTCSQANTNGPNRSVMSTQSVKETCKKIPTGCVGAYRRAISQATHHVARLVKEERMRNYKSLSEEEQRLLGTALLDACASDDGLENVKDIVAQGIDVEDFFVASDGTETSALHAAAFHGSIAILEFLCHGLDDRDEFLYLKTSNSRCFEDGGLCNVNLKDPNGWTALHFAAGTNCRKSIQILARHGAILTVEAANGYSPYQWALRLQNQQVAQELLLLLQEQNDTKHESWSSPSRFFLSLGITNTAYVLT